MNYNDINNRLYDILHTDNLSDEDIDFVINNCSLSYFKDFISPYCSDDLAENLDLKRIILKVLKSKNLKLSNFLTEIVPINYIGLFFEIDGVNNYVLKKMLKLACGRLKNFKDIPNTNENLSEHYYFSKNGYDKLLSCKEYEAKLFARACFGYKIPNIYNSSKSVAINNYYSVDKELKPDLSNNETEDYLTIIKNIYDGNYKEGYFFKLNNIEGFKVFISFSMLNFVDIDDFAFYFKNIFNIDYDDNNEYVDFLINYVKDKIPNKKCEFMFGECLLAINYEGRKKYKNIIIDILCRLRSYRSDKYGFQSGISAFLSNLDSFELLNILERTKMQEVVLPVINRLVVKGIDLEDLYLDLDTLVLVRKDIPKKYKDDVLSVVSFILNKFGINKFLTSLKFAFGTRYSPTSRKYCSNYLSDFNFESLENFIYDICKIQTKANDVEMYKIAIYEIFKDCILNIKYSFYDGNLDKDDKNLAKILNEYPFSKLKSFFIKISKYFKMSNSRCLFNLSIVIDNILELSN